MPTLSHLHSSHLCSTIQRIGPLFCRFLCATNNNSSWKVLLYDDHCLGICAFFVSFVDWRLRRLRSLESFALIANTIIGASITVGALTEVEVDGRCVVSAVLSSSLYYFYLHMFILGPLMSFSIIISCFAWKGEMRFSGQECSMIIPGLLLRY